MGILLAPGPVYVPEELMLEQVKEMITHRGTEFSKDYEYIVEWLKKGLNAYEAYCITGSGGLCIETLFANLSKPGDKSLVLANGQFGENLYKTAVVYTEAKRVDLKAGTGWNLERAKEHIDASDAKILAMVYNETGYGIRNHAKEIIQYAKKKGMTTIMDCVSAWPALPLDMKEFGLDGFATGCQKATGVPPGAGYVGISKDASDYVAKLEKPRGYYMDLKRHRKMYEEKKETPNTPAVSIFWAIKKSMQMIEAQGGIKPWEKKHDEISAYVRSRLIEMGFELLPEKGYESPTVTAFKFEKAKELKKLLKTKYAISMVGCKGEFENNGLRLAHMGHFNRGNIEIALDLLAKAKKEI